MKTHITIEIPSGYTSHECLDLIARALAAMQREQHKREAREAREDVHTCARVIRALRANVSRTRLAGEYVRALQHARRKHRDALPVADSSGDADACEALAQQFTAMSEAHYFARTETIIG